MTDYNSLWKAMQEGFLAPARAYMAQSPKGPPGLLGDIHRAIDPVNAFGGYGGLLAMAVPPGAGSPEFSFRSAGLSKVPAPTKGKIEVTPTTKQSEFQNQWGGTKALTVDGDTKAIAQIYVSPNGVRIQHIETLPGYRRKGYASRLVKSIQQEFPGAKLSTSMRTDSGSALFRKLGID